MIKARRAFAGLLAGVAAFAAFSGTARAAQAELPVRATATYEDGVARVGTAYGDRQPLAGAWVDTNTGKACAGFSYQVPQCVQLGFSIDTTTAQTIVTIDSDASDGRVGVFTQFGGQPLVAVTYNFFSGALCAGFSYQVPICITTNG